MKGAYALVRFMRDFPEVCDLWKSFDTRARYSADNMHQAYEAGYNAALEAVAPAPTATPDVLHPDPLERKRPAPMGFISLSEFDDEPQQASERKAEG